MVKSGEINSFNILTLSPKGNKSEKAKYFLKKQLLKIIKHYANHDTDDDFWTVTLHETG